MLSRTNLLREFTCRIHHVSRLSWQHMMVCKVHSASGPDLMSDTVDNISIKSEDVTEEYLRWNPPSVPPKFHMSFAGCGFLGIYHLGVAKALIVHGRHFLEHVERFGGASAGSLVAGILAVKGYDEEVIDTCTEWCLNSAKTINKKPLGLLTPRYNLLASLEEFLNNLMPEDGFERASKKLFVSLTTLEGKKNVILSEFETNEDVTRALLGSSYVPHITGTKPVKLKGKKYIDGGLTSNLPQMPGADREVKMVYVSPFSGGYQISPYDKRGKNWVTKINGQHFQVNVDNLIRGYHAFNPPKPQQLQKYYRRGILDTVRFLRREKFYNSAIPMPSRGISFDSSEILSTTSRSKSDENLTPDFNSSRKSHSDSSSNSNSEENEEKDRERRAKPTDHSHSNGSTKSEGKAKIGNHSHSFESAAVSRKEEKARLSDHSHSFESASVSSKSLEQKSKPGDHSEYHSDSNENVLSSSCSSNSTTAFKITVSADITGKLTGECQTHYPIQAVPAVPESAC